jgi:hypothetical protein
MEAVRHFVFGIVSSPGENHNFAGWVRRFQATVIGVLTGAHAMCFRCRASTRGNADLFAFEARRKSRLRYSVSRYSQDGFNQGFPKYLVPL